MFSVVYNVLFEREETEKINPAELVKLVEYFTKLAEKEDQAFEGISTDIAVADRAYSMVDEIIERFNAHYHN